MTQEQIEIEAQNYLNGLDLSENADKQLIVDNFKNGMAWALLMFDEEKQQMIENTRKFLIEWSCNYIAQQGGSVSQRKALANDILTAYKKAMED